MNNKKNNYSAFKDVKIYLKSINTYKIFSMKQNKNNLTCHLWKIQVLE